MIFRIVWVFVICCALAPVVRAQESLKPRPSPLAVVSTRYKETYLKIVYSQPHKRGREVFGKLVPFDSVWRMGANEATEITITHDISVNGTPLKAGTYSLFCIPRKDHWTIIINSDLGQWGSYNYNSKMDVLLFDAPVLKTDGLTYEPFTIAIEGKNNKANIVFLWDTTRVSFEIEFNEPKTP